MVLKIQTISEPVFQVKDNDGQPDTLSLWMFASSIAESLNNPLVMNLLTFKLSTVRHVELSFCLGENSIKETLEDPPNGKFVESGWNTLPQSIKQQVLAKVKEIQQADPPAK